MTVSDASDQVICTKLEDEVYLGESTGDGTSGAAVFGGFEDEGTKVAGGSYVVPEGVAVEELKNYKGHKELKDKCPDDVRALLQEKGLFDVYDQFVQSIVDEKNTRGTFTGNWKDQQFVSVLDQFRDQFTEKGVMVALCKRKSGSGTFRWLEFIDIDNLDGTYVPQFDISNRSGQVIKTCYYTLQFPIGVAVEELKSWGGRKKLKEKVPIHVEKMLQKYELMEEYTQMIDDVVEAGVNSRFKTWNLEKLKALLAVYQPKFSQKGVDIYISTKEEWVQHGNSGHMEHFRWIEFVDRAVQPSYEPQRDAATKSQNCVVM